MKEFNTLDMVNQIRELAQYIDSLQDRINKATEYIEEDCGYVKNCDEASESYDNLLKILKGEDDEGQS